jgi:hypothetical protein
MVPSAPIRAPDNENLDEPRRPDPSETPDATPPGITLVSLTRVVVAAFLALVGYLLLYGLQPASGVVAVGLAVAELPVAWGLWALRPWALRGALVLWALVSVAGAVLGQPLVVVVTLASAGYLLTKRGHYD